MKRWWFSWSTYSGLYRLPVFRYGSFLYPLIGFALVESLSRGVVFEVALINYCSLSVHLSVGCLFEILVENRLALTYYSLLCISLACICWNCLAWRPIRTFGRYEEFDLGFGASPAEVEYLNKAAKKLGVPIENRSVGEIKRDVFNASDYGVASIASSSLFLLGLIGCLIIAIVNISLVSLLLFNS
jgi:hypothetical protein